MEDLTAAVAGRRADMLEEREGWREAGSKSNIFTILIQELVIFIYMPFTLNYIVMHIHWQMPTSFNFHTPSLQHRLSAMNQIKFIVS